MVFMIVSFSSVAAESRICISGPCNGSGSISFQVSNVEKTQQEIEKISEKYEAKKQSFNASTNSTNNKKSISGSYIVSIDNVDKFIREVSMIKGIISQSYSENAYSGYNIDDMKSKLASYKKHLKSILTSNNADDNIVALLTQQITSLESQLTSMGNISDKDAVPAASVYISIVEKGYNNQSYYHEWIEAFRKFILPAGILLLLLLATGYFIGKNFTLKRSG